MSDNRHLVASIGLNMYPSYIQGDLLRDAEFVDKFDLHNVITTTLTWNGEKIGFQRSELYNAIRRLVADPALKLEVNDNSGRCWVLEYYSIAERNGVKLGLPDRELLLPSFLVFSENSETRLLELEQISKGSFISGPDLERWRRVLSERVLTDSEVEEFLKDVADSPIHIAGVLESVLGVDSEIKTSAFVPSSLRYYERLVGKHLDSETILDYAQNEGAEHMRALVSWREYDGFMYSLLLSGHASMGEVVKGEVGIDTLVRAFKELLVSGDRLSQVGAIEIFLMHYSQHSQLIPLVKKMIDLICSDGVEESPSEFALYSLLVIFVEDQFAQRKIVSSKPVYWRRLAAMSQAALIFRCLVRSNAELHQFKSIFEDVSGPFFYVQSLIDIRAEPRWFPEYITESFLKAGAICRLAASAIRNEGVISDAPLRELLLGDAPGIFQFVPEKAKLWFPGPLDAGLLSDIDPPEDISKKILDQLNASPLALSAFSPLINCAVVYRLEARYAELASKALKEAEYQLVHSRREDHLLGVLSGIANVAAVTRSTELAQSLKILARRYTREPGHHLLGIREALWIGVAAAGSYSDLKGWCEFVGEWTTDLAFGSMNPQEAEELSYHIWVLCDLVPDLWRTCGQAKVAVDSMVAR